MTKSLFLSNLDGVIDDSQPGGMLGQNSKQGVTAKAKNPGPNGGKRRDTKGETEMTNHHGESRSDTTQRGTRFKIEINEQRDQIAGILPTAWRR
jgi:hypothetical protein